LRGVFRRAGRSGITAWAVNVHGKSSVKLSPTRAPQATIPAELPHGSHFAIHCDYPTSIAAATAANTSRALLVNYNVRGVSRNRGAPRQDCIETPAKSEVGPIYSRQFAGNERLQSTATILITTGDPVAVIGIGAAHYLTYRCRVSLFADRISRREDLSYFARDFRMRRARSSSDLGINRITSPIVAPSMN